MISENRSNLIAFTSTYEVLIMLCIRSVDVLCSDDNCRMLSIAWHRLYRRIVNATSGAPFSNAEVSSPHKVSCHHRMAENIDVFDFSLTDEEGTLI